MRGRAGEKKGTGKGNKGKGKKREGKGKEGKEGDTRFLPGLMPNPLAGLRPWAPMADF